MNESPLGAVINFKAALRSDLCVGNDEGALKISANLGMTGLSLLQQRGHSFLIKRICGQASPLIR